MANAKATIDGEPILGRRNFEWQLTKGVAPFMSVALVSPASRDRLLGGKLRPVTLVIGDQKFESVYVIEEAPAHHPDVAAVRIADRRWFWHREIFSRSYNIRRTVGTKRVVTPGTPPILDPLVDSVSFAPFSLKNERVKWRAKEIVENIFTGRFSEDGDGILTIEKKATGSQAPFKIDSVGSAKPLPVQDLVLEDNGNGAAQRVLSYLPGTTVTVDANGTVRVVNQASGRETEVIDKKGGPEIDGQGHIAFLTNDRVRPKRVVVWFTKLHEIRFDSDEGSRDYTRAGGADDRRIADNVMPVPDLTLSGYNPPLSRGTWVPIDDRLFRAWGPIPNFGLVTFDKLRQWLAPKRDIWSIVEISGAQDPNADWSARLSALQQHYRRTYRINRRWRDRIKQWYPFLVATVDAVTGTRAPAQAFMNYSVIPTQRTLLALAATNQPLRYDIPVKAYDEGKGSIDKMKAAPASFRIVDQDQGVFQLDLLMDEFRLNQMLIPGLIKNSPTANARNNSRLAWTMIAEGVEPPELDPSFDVSVLFSAISGSPNRRGRLYPVFVEPKDVADMLPQGAQAGLGKAVGPEMHVRVGPGLEQARVSWSDRRINDIEASFGLSSRQANIDDLIVNLDVTGAGGSLNDIAKAIAARVYAEFVDRYEGQATYDASLAKIEGYLESILYRISSRGATTMQIKPMDRIDGVFDEQSFMPSSLRNFLDRVASVHGSPT